MDMLGVCTPAEPSRLAGAFMLWYLLACLLIAGLGLIMFLRPGWLWLLTESWKSYRADEPSDLYILSTKVGGIAFMVVTVAAAAQIFLK